MKKSIKRVLSMLLVAILVLGSIPMMSFAENSQSTIIVRGSDGYVASADVTNLPVPYANGNYNAYCADKNTGITADHSYNTSFSVYTESNRIAFLLNSNITSDEKVIQQLIWRIMNGSYNNPGNLQNTADDLWLTYFQKTETYKKGNKTKTRIVDKLDSEFKSASSSDYNNIIFLASTNGKQPIFVVSHKKYEVKFIVFDNNLIKTEIVSKGSDATPPTVPTRVDYDFTGWNGSYTNIQNNTTVTALYTIKHFDVEFVDHDGTELKTETVNYNEAATAPEDPSRTGYDFTGWDVAFNHITSNLTVTAQYTIKHFTVSFFDKDGDLIEAQPVNYGNDATAPTAPSETGFDFTGWDAGFTNVQSDLNINALYTDKTFTVRFYNGEVLLDTQTVKYGLPASAPADPEQDGKTFSSWDTDFSSIIDNLDVHALYTTNTYPVTFVDYDSTVLKTQSVEYGLGATAPSDPSRDHFTFTGWDKSFDEITGPLTVTAQYTEDSKGQLTVTHTYIDNTGRNSFMITYGFYGVSYLAAPDPHEGYTYQVTGSESGVYGEVAQTVAYVYTPIPDETQAPSETQPTTQPTTQAPTQPQGPQGSIVVNFVDTNGVSLASSINFTGTAGTLYQTSAKSIEGYELVETPANASGSFVDGTVTVDYVYSDGTVVIEDEANALGDAKAPVNFDSIFDNMEITTEAASDEAIILDESTPLADALPQTGQASPELFYGIGSIVSVLGIYIKRKNK